MSKIIVDNRSNLPDKDALMRVMHVVCGGRVSGDSYCFVTTWMDGIAVSARRNKASDTFVIWSQSDE